MNKMYQIAIDGPAASGKSTVARLLAGRLGGFYVNTGDMYRTIANAALKAGISPENEPDRLVKALDGWSLGYERQNDGSILLMFNGEPVKQSEIRAPEVAAVVSHVAKIAGVRDWLLDCQRRCTSLGIIIMEGRDIGTVIFPQAKYKFFVTATPMERARRRLAQAGEVQDGATLEQVAAQIAERDRIDSTRAVAPLKPASDAVLVETDGLTAEQVADKLISLMESKQ